MASKAHVELNGVGTNKIDLEILNDEARERLIECVRKNGRISILVGAERALEGGENGFAQSVD
jgi:hypothetical protein